MNSFSYLSATLLRRKSDALDTNAKDQFDNEFDNFFKIKNIDHQIVDGISVDSKTIEDFVDNSSQLDQLDDLIDRELKNNSAKKYVMTILCIPRVLIYLPLYYLLWLILYPFKRIYFLFAKVFNWMFITEPNDSADVLHTHSEIMNNQYLDSPTIETPSSSCLLPTSNSSNRYLPKSSISTIVEESMEFDPDDQNDDYFKSPLDTRPVISAVDIEDKPDSRLSELERTSKGNVFMKTHDLPLEMINEINTLSKNNRSDDNFDSALKINTLGYKTPVKLSSQKAIRKKKKFVFPKLLFDFDISNPPNLPRKTLVLDLDETLIHSLSRYNSSAMNKSKGQSIEVKVAGNVPTLYHIYKRPYVEEFLSIVYQWFDLVCFTASIKEYADPVVSYLEEQVLSSSVLKKTHEKHKFELPKKIFKQRFYRNSCIFIEGKGYVKDLSMVLNEQNAIIKKQTSKLTIASSSNSKSRASSISSNVSRSSNPSSNLLDYSKIVIIDNSPISYIRHKDNGLMVEGWINDPDDTELMNLLPVLNSLRFVSDVRCVLGLKKGQEIFK